MTRVWNNLHQVRSKTKDWKTKQLKVLGTIMDHLLRDEIYNSISKNYSCDTDYSISSLLAPLSKSVTYAMITKSYPANVGAKHQSINQVILLSVVMDTTQLQKKQ